MSVYVGTIEYSYGRMKMFHMATDGDETELHAMADKIGIKRKWFQNKPNRPHYDICKSKKALALSLGVCEVNDRELITKCFIKK